jgi:DNA-binding NarL/FixJ family response regulator
MIDVLIVDDHPLFRKGLRASLEEHPDIHVMGEAGTGRETLAMLTRQACHVLILDISLPDISGIEVLKSIIANRYSCRVLILSTYPEKQYAVRCLRAGALSYITKDSASRELITAVRRVAEGRRYVSMNLADQMASMLSKEESGLPHEQLSDREFEIFCMLGDGLTVAQIANQLTLSPATVYTYRSRITFKTGLASTAEIVRYVLEHGISAA